MFAEACEQFGLMFGSKRRDDVGKVTVHDGIELIKREIDAVIRDAPLWVVVGTDAFASVAASHEALTFA